VYSMGVSFGLIEKIVFGVFEYVWVPFYYVIAREFDVPRVFSVVVIYGIAVLVFMMVGFSVIVVDLLVVVIYGQYVVVVGVVIWMAIGVFFYGVYLLISIGFNIIGCMLYYLVMIAFSVCLLGMCYFARWAVMCVWLSGV